MPLSAAKFFLGKLRRAIRGFFENVFERPGRLPAVIPIVSLGKSVEGRDIDAYRLGHGNKQILFVGGLHGNEIGSIKAMRGFLKAGLPLEFLEEVTVWVVPCLNPDGYAQAQRHPDYWHGGRIGRFNANGVDLNRNFPTKSFQSHSEWTHGKAYQDRTEVYAGPHGGSEPETQALVQFIQAQKILLLAMFHTAGADVTGNNDERGHTLARAYAKAADYRFFTEQEWRVLGHTGSAKEWCQENGVTFLEIEGSTRWGSDWERHKKGIGVILNF